MKATITPYKVYYTHIFVLFNFDQKLLVFWQTCVFEHKAPSLLLFDRVAEKSLETYSKLLELKKMWRKILPLCNRNSIWWLRINTLYYRVTCLSSVLVVYLQRMLLYYLKVRRYCTESPSISMSPIICMTVLSVNKSSYI